MRGDRAKRDGDRVGNPKTVLSDMKRPSRPFSRRRGGRLRPPLPPAIRTVPDEASSWKTAGIPAALPCGLRQYRMRATCTKTRTRRGRRVSKPLGDRSRPAGDATRANPPLMRRFIFFFSYHLILNRRGIQTTRAAGFRLRVRPTVFHPRFFLSSEYFAEFIDGLDLEAKASRTSARRLRHSRSCGGSRCAQQAFWLSTSMPNAVLSASWEDTDDLGAPLDFAVQPLDRIVGMNLCAVILGEGHVG